MVYIQINHILPYAIQGDHFPFLYFLEINNNITSFPKKNTVFPLNGYFIIDYDASVISTPHTDILLAIKYSFADFNDSNI